MSPNIAALKELASAELTRTRGLTPQVVDSLLSQHEVVPEEVVTWLREEIEQLESYEQDILFSPLFTPDFALRVRFEDALNGDCLSEEEVARLIGELVDNDLRMTLEYESKIVESAMPAVAIERLVHMLHLDLSLPSAEMAPFRPLSAEVRCLLRERTWQRPQHRDLLPTLLSAVRSTDTDFTDAVHFLTDFVRSHRPTTREECVTFLTNVADAYEEDLKKHTSGDRSFFNPELKASYAGKWKVEDNVVERHKRAIAIARELRSALS